MTSGYWTGQQFFLALEKNPEWGGRIVYGLLLRVCPPRILAEWHQEGRLEDVGVFTLYHIPYVDVVTQANRSYITLS